ncbi:hypothetical protein [Bdellovibrio sp. HCB-162]|uniref:hypothetical protein n=1 Tax=Bdellovibrio sp. HCB-162 TaxID=3394234 RepID=UPI0039BD64E5
MKNEELLIGKKIERTHHSHIMRVVEGMLELSVLTPKLEAMKQACDLGNVEFVKTSLKDLVFEYEPAQHTTGKIH